MRERVRERVSVREENGERENKENFVPKQFSEVLSSRKNIFGSVAFPPPFKVCESELSQTVGKRTGVVQDFKWVWHPKHLINFLG